MRDNGLVLPSWFVYVGVVVGVVGILPYLRDTMRGVTQPHRVTWFLWGFIPLVTFLIQIHVGVGIQALMTFTYFATPMAVLVASFAAGRGSWAIAPVDWACGALSLVGLAVYLVTAKGALAIGLLIVADFFAALPTLRKSFSHPESETWTAFLAGFISATLTVATITDWNFATYAFPAYIAVQNFTEVLLIRFHLGLRLRARASTETS